MSQLISFCGIDCTNCEARTATLNNDDKLRQEVADKWKVAHGFAFTADMINCTGCRVEGVKIGHWTECQIRLCAVARGYEHCGKCPEISECKNIKFVHDFLPEAINNLRSLK